jgi:hypothetical protein
MKVISKSDCHDWLKTNAGSDLTVEKIGEAYPFSVAYLISPDTGKKTALGRVLTGLLHVASQGLFWITATGIWPSSENMALFDGYRKSFGESRPVAAAPGHMFIGSDSTQIECLLDLALYFSWDSVLFEGHGGAVFRTSHDEYVSIYTKDRDRLSQIDRALRDLELEPLSRG